MTKSEGWTVETYSYNEEVWGIIYYDPVWFISFPLSWGYRGDNQGIGRFLLNFAKQVGRDG